MDLCPTTPNIFSIAKLSPLWPELSQTQISPQLHQHRSAPNWHRAVPFTHTRDGVQWSFCFLRKRKKESKKREKRKEKKRGKEKESNNCNRTCLGSVVTHLMESTLCSETQTFKKYKSFRNTFWIFFVGAGNISAPVLHPCRSPRGSGGSGAAR